MALVSSEFFCDFTLFLSSARLDGKIADVGFSGNFLICYKEDELSELVIVGTVEGLSFDERAAVKSI